jgi:hypothetical protein
MSSAAEVKTAATPILGGKDRHAARHSKEKEDEQKENLIRQP